ncbi:MAG TPA: GNAT family N-acetyltransferase [Thermoanaerobaculia bacterium]|nr:GNAT family N-acetyltransferase [Thermoanaerobaculia bacterium]
MSYEKRRGELEVSTDPARLDVAAVFAFLAASYWAEGIPLEVVERSLANSLCFGLYAPAEPGLGRRERQIGLARVITDFATFAYLCDVYVLPEHQGQGLGRWLMESVMEHPGLAGLRRFGLVTRDAHELYRPFGFAPLAHPDRHMESVRPGLYQARVGTRPPDQSRAGTRAPD